MLLCLSSLWLADVCWCVTSVQEAWRQVTLLLHAPWGLHNVEDPWKTILKQWTFSWACSQASIFMEMNGPPWHIMEVWSLPVLLPNLSLELQKCLPALHHVQRKEWQSESLQESNSYLPSPCRSRGCWRCPAATPWTGCAQPRAFFAAAAGTERSLSLWRAVLACPAGGGACGCCWAWWVREGTRPSSWWGFHSARWGEGEEFIWNHQTWPEISKSEKNLNEIKKKRSRGEQKTYRPSHSPSHRGTWTLQPERPSGCFPRTTAGKNKTKQNKLR